MRKVLALLLAVAVNAPLTAQTPSIDDIVSHYQQRIGGAERLGAIQSVRRTGKFYGGGGFEANVKNENKRPNKVREEFAFGGMVGVNAYDGRAGWKIEPWQGKKDAESLSEDELKGIIEDAEFDDPLLDYQKKGNKVELVGTDQIEGTDVYKVRATLASNGDVRTYYLDQDSYVPIKYEVKRMVRGAEREFEVELGDYKEVNGVYFPFSFAIGAKGSSSANKAQYAWERIEANVAIPDAAFSRPAAPGGSQNPGDAKDASNQLPKPDSAKAAAPKPPTLEQAGEVVSFGLRVENSQLSTPNAVAAAVVDSNTFSGLGARNIGSAAMSGRVAAIAATHDEGRLTIYVGAAS
ncbi:MAG TPA: hypothetical protein VJ867_00070, partial [Gemmatimonadaceae bacterium]|nr:hypothetical protein [Gemmatimonadaceae bacterium]